MQWWLFMDRLSHRLRREQKKALAGKIPMTRELFWGCLNVYYARSEMGKFWEVWNAYPEFSEEWSEPFDQEAADAWRKQMEKKLADALREKGIKK